MRGGASRGCGVTKSEIGDMGRANSALLFLSALSVAVLLEARFETQAAPVFCPGTAATTDREFSLTTTPDATCLAFGPGNINGNNDVINLLGYVTLDKSDDASSGAAP